MTRLLICPSDREAFRFLSHKLPLACVPLLGQSLLEYWLSTLAIAGTKKVIVLAHDRPELALDIVGEGERWGLAAKVLSESRELTPAEALIKYAAELGDGCAQNAITVLDHLPGLNGLPLFANHQDWLAALQRWMPSALMPDRVGANETLPGIWKCCHAHVSAQAQLRAPCWIGQHAFIGARAIIGPGTVLEDGCFVEPGAELADNWIGPDTFVGQFARIKNSFAWGNALLNWQTGSETQVADPFLLCAVRRPRRRRKASWFKKLADHYDRNKSEVALLWKHLLLHKG